MTNDPLASPFTDFTHQFMPAKSQQSGPTLLFLHGTGGTEKTLLNLGRMLIPDAARLSPRGKVSEDGTLRFFRRLSVGVFDLDDLRRRTDELADFVLAASQNYQFDAAQVIAVGYSNGANIAASMLLLRPGILQAAVLLRPMLPLIPDLLPDLTATPVFISAGRTDELVPVARTEQLAQVLRQAGADVSEHWLNSGHKLSHEDVREAKAWLHRMHYV
jgi:phospholipase/carboxylesterase/glyoxalase family protein